MLLYRRFEDDFERESRAIGDQISVQLKLKFLWESQNNKRLMARYLKNAKPENTEHRKNTKSTSKQTMEPGKTKDYKYKISESKMPSAGNPVHMSPKPTEIITAQWSTAPQSVSKPTQSENPSARKPVSSKPVRAITAQGPTAEKAGKKKKNKKKSGSEQSENPSAGKLVSPKPVQTITAQGPTAEKAGKKNKNKKKSGSEQSENPSERKPVSPKASETIMAQGLGMKPKSGRSTTALA